MLFRSLGLFRQGATWYRQRFTLPAVKKQKDFSYILVIGGADNMVKVWCNGKFAGGTEKPGGLCAPRIFDLGDTIKPGEENLLAIEVIRFGNFELGTGGIMLPSFISYAPALKKQNTEQDFDILSERGKRFLQLFFRYAGAITFGFQGHNTRYEYEYLPITDNVLSSTRRFRTFQPEDFGWSHQNRMKISETTPVHQDVPPLSTSYGIVSPIHGRGLFPLEAVYEN